MSPAVGVEDPRRELDWVVLAVCVCGGAQVLEEPRGTRL